jgi:predicted transcriptional regulator of viral defense system
MRFASLVELAGGMECFDFAMLVQAVDEQREAVRVQLSRWMKQGLVVGLRRGMYTLPEIFRRTALTPPTLANQLYRPSYLSGLWALGYHDMIPERVVWLTSVTPFGVFEYRSLKQDAFFGYVAAPFDGRELLVATPEKALLDHWHLTSGEWSVARLEEMRYQNPERVEEERLRAFADRFASPRLVRAARRWLTLRADEERGTVLL